MTRHLTKISIWGCLAIMLLYSCGDSTSIGADIFSGEEIDVQFVDTIGIKAKTVAVDSFASASTVLLLGAIDDPVFGTTRADLIARIDTNRFSGLVLDDTGELTIDSMVLILGSSDVLNYGDSLKRSISLDIFRVEEDLTDDIYYSNADIDVSEQPIGSLTNYLLNFDSTLVFNPLVDSVVVEGPQIRVPMTDDFKDWFKQEVINSEGDILDIFKGIKISPAEGSTGLITSVNFNLDQGTRFRMYFDQNDSIRIYDYIVTSPFFNLVETDETGTDVETALDDEQVGDSILYLQPLNGTQIELDVSNLRSLSGTYINEVVLEMTLVEDNVGNIGHFTPIPSLKLSTLNDEGVFETIADIPPSTTASTVELFFGGGLSDSENGVRRYSMNITQFVKNSLSDDAEMKPLFINGLFEGIANRSVIFGPGHMLYPMKLKVTYTLP